MRQVAQSEDLSFFSSSSPKGKGRGKVGRDGPPLVTKSQAAFKNKIATYAPCIVRRSKKRREFMYLVLLSRS